MPAPALPLGIRRGWSDWQKNTPTFVSWAKAVGIDVIDLANGTAADIAVLRENGIRLGSVDLFEFPKLLAADAGERRDRIARNIDYINEMTRLGAKVFFTCLLPADPAASRASNYAIAAETYAPLAQAVHAAGASIAVEGYPGHGPYFAALCCTPETVRRFLKDVGPGAGLNYDPSHLIRLGVDHIRFLKEFAPHVKHVHGKDTDIDADLLYEFGHLQPATFAKDPAFGGPSWRYTLPGHGLARWREIFTILRDASYAGAVCVELEDANFNGTEAGEKAGLQHAMAHLRGVAL